MKLTVQEVFDITLMVSAIIRDKRPMPQRGKFLLARMHAKLLPEFNVVSEQRDELIKEYDHADPDTASWSVPVDKMPEFNAKWAVIAAVSVEVDVTPISLADLDLPGANGGIEASELSVLGDLITE